MLFKCSKYPKYKVILENKTVCFNNGEYRTTDKKEIEVLKTIIDIKVEEEKKKVDKKSKTE